MAGRCRTIVAVEPDGGLRITCERCDYYAEIPKSAIGLPLGDCVTGTLLLRVVFHVEHIENEVPAHALRP